MQRLDSPQMPCGIEVSMNESSNVLTETPVEPTRAEVQLLTISEAADLLSVSRSKLYVLMGDGELQSVKLGGSRRIRLQSLKELVERHTVLPAA